jgi:3-isopropylmalate dehydrogenase
MILSAALMLRISLGLENEARAVEDAVRDTIEGGIRTPDIRDVANDPVSTRGFGDAVAERVRAA